MIINAYTAPTKFGVFIGFLLLGTFALVSTSPAAQAASAQTYCAEGPVGLCFETREQAESFIRSREDDDDPAIAFLEHAFTTVGDDGSLSYQYQVPLQAPTHLTAIGYGFFSFAELPCERATGTTDCVSEEAAIQALITQESTKPCPIVGYSIIGNFGDPYSDVSAFGGTFTTGYIDYALSRAMVAQIGCPGYPIQELTYYFRKIQTFTCGPGFRPDVYYNDETMLANFEKKLYCGSRAQRSIRTQMRQVESCPANKNPCFPSTGDKARFEEDFSFAGRSFFRNYHSLQQQTSRVLSRGWTHSYEEAIAYSPSNFNLVIHTDDKGYIETFRFADNSSLRAISLSGSGRTLVRPSMVFNDFQIVEPGGEVKTFDRYGRLVSIADPASSLSDAFLTYDEVGLGRLIMIKDHRGRTVNLNYDGSRLSGITLPDGTLVSYGYDTRNNLASAGVAGSVKEYLYESGNGLLTGIVDEAGSRYASFGYDVQGRVTSSALHGTNGLVDTTTLVYDQNGQVEVTTASGGVVSYQIRDDAYRTIASILDNQGSIDFQYHPDGRRSRSTDRRGVVETYEYVGANLSAVASAVGTADERRLEFIFNARGKVVQRSIFDTRPQGVALAKREKATFDSADRMTAGCVIDPGIAGSDSYVCGSGENVPAGVRETRYGYCTQTDVDSNVCPSAGLLIRVDGPRTDVSDWTTYTYYPSDDPTCASAPTTCPHRKGDLWKVTNALGHVTETLKYDGAGRVLSMKDPNAVVTDFEYHPRGWLTASKVRGADSAVETDDQITRIDYWPTGLVKKVTQPDGAFTSYTYDAAHRLTDIADNAGNTIRYTLDTAGNRLQEDTRTSSRSFPRSELKRTLSRVYNQLGQLSTQADAQSNPTDFTYDANGNPERTIDALDRVTDTDYDPLNRLSRTLQDVGGIAAETTFGYDAQDNLTKVKDPKGLDTDYTYNGLGDLLTLISPDTGTTTYTYDSGGNRKTQVDARGVTATYGYDALNRLTSIAYSDGTAGATYTYDSALRTECLGSSGGSPDFAKGRLSKMSDASGTTQYCYNRFGQLAAKSTNGVAAQLRYTYTLSGQLQSVSYPDRALVDYIRDAQGRVTEIGVKSPGGVRQVLLNQAAYYPFGPVSGWVYGNGRSLQRTYNLNYQPEKVLDASAGGLSLRYGFNAVGNLTQLDNGFQSAVLARYDYDALNRLSDVKDGPTSTVLEHYGYDATGNRLSLTNSAGTTNYTYPTTNHRLTQVGPVARTFDAVGNTATVGGTAKGFVYNGANRMSQVMQGGTVAATYIYNGRGEQVRRTVGSTTTTTYYDEAGHWIGDYSGTTPLQQVVWLDDLPVGLLVGSGSAQTLHYIEPDHLGTPRVVIEQARNVAIWNWDAKGEAFGNTAPNQNPDGDATNLVLNMRFPGQRYDAVSGLNQNYFRDYEAGTGRYSQSDPIGLEAGMSTYSYTDSRPLANLDPYGLAAIEIVLPAAPPQVAPWLVAASRFLGPVAATLSLSGSTPQPCQNDDLCEKAKGEARYAYNVLMSKRIPQFQSGGTNGRDANHLKTILEFQTRLQKKLASVRRNCVPLPIEYVEWYRVAYLNSPGF